MDDNLSAFLITLMLALVVFSLGGIFGSVTSQPEQVIYSGDRCLVQEKIMYCEVKEPIIEFSWEN